ncbi:hypothetical protein M747DRAFT_244746 [Aspergillus niger ATCC 13496]|uniref:Uncharacterized protein n=3 Tax=Aspergillus niger TaxID=5061 RepID=A2QMT3_ASPNC|nr:hypothetical protein An07g03230 [Aspergillus niger]RDH16638.1 hypothetical protein M747DRAFT_244746 [Aspergillus niger ATCC 13496]CAL00257.1 hypothetical protein An07g03230 [Aspergillus niger]
MDTRGEKVHKRMVICGSCGRLEEEKEEALEKLGKVRKVSSPTSKTSLERKGVVESLRGAEVLSERLQFDVKKGAWRSVPRGEGLNSGPRDQDYRGVFSPRCNRPDASDEPITGPVSGKVQISQNGAVPTGPKKKKRSTEEHRQACAQGYTSISPNRDVSLLWNHGSSACSPKIEGKGNQDMTRINANEGTRANSHCSGAMLAAIVRCSRLSGEYLRSDGVWGVMTVGDPIVHNWRTEDPKTSRRPIMLQAENQLLVPIALRKEHDQQYAKNWPFLDRQPYFHQVCDSREEGKLPIRAFMVQVDLGLNRTRARNYCRVDLNPAGSSQRGNRGQEVPQVWDTLHVLVNYNFALVLSPLSDNPIGNVERDEDSPIAQKPPFDSSWMRTRYRHDCADHTHAVAIPCCIFPRVDLYHTYEEVPQRRYGSNQPFVILSSAGRILFSIKFGFLPLQKASASPMSRICGLSINDVVRATVAGLSKIALTTSSYTGMTGSWHMYWGSLADELCS